LNLFENLQLLKENIITLEIDKTEDYDIAYASIDGQSIGRAVVLTSKDLIKDFSIIERIDINEKLRNQGLGTQLINELTKVYGSLLISAADSNSARLYNKLGTQVYKTFNKPEDYGFGVYKIG